MKFLNTQKNLKASFTLLELIVAIALIALIMTLGTINYRRSAGKTTMMMAAHQIAADARLMESYAASARQYGTATPPDNQWGVYFSKGANQYILFVDKDENAYYSGGADAIWRTVKLPKTIKIKELKYLNAGAWTAFGANAGMSVVYTPPSPSSTIMINSSGWTEKNEVKVILTDDSLNDGKEISFNFFGLIDVIK